MKGVVKVAARSRKRGVAPGHNTDRLKLNVYHSDSSGAVLVVIPPCPLRSAPIPDESNEPPSLMIRVLSEPGLPDLWSGG
jgi:hypothetical protein